MTAYFLVFQAPINTNTSQQLIATCAQLIAQQATEINLLISTPGGEVPAGMTAYNMLKALPVTLNTHNIGNIDSIGNAIFLAGTSRKSCAHSTFMFHGVGINAPGTRLEQKNLQEILDAILSDQRRIGNVIQERTQIGSDEVGELFREARTKDANYALSKGIVHAIEDVAIPPGAPIVSLVVS